MRSQLTLGALTMLGAMVATPAWAGGEECQGDGVPVTIEVLDMTGQPIPTAKVRHVDEKYLHPVNAATGRWTDCVLYMPNGDELVFEKGMLLEFEVSAPGYENKRFGYPVKKRKNLGSVQLEAMKLDLQNDEEMDDPVIQFGRDKPID